VTRFKSQLVLAFSFPKRLLWFFRHSGILVSVLLKSFLREGYGRA